ncbi:hypothetical protein [Pedobacter sp. Leaf194]|uniref:hypothetical protein n=1 Tax=Pedobacter sp. Leaf194 TaxID=1736297 RepID=UPI00070335E9|nr:hypothetical protein [Pedobacter sp. Leaf194]KQS40577.1 hypothetical protein ASG14_18970 [Pedobacter sp. Leaf194]RYD78802.1 MAG: hypothetical protein EOP55_06290 [Sphingobacteriales bacterium]
MKVKGTLVITLETGEKALILLAENKSEQEKLYHYLSVDAYKFKSEISEEAPRIDFISAGYNDDDDQIIWEDNYIPVPKWYEKN